MNTQERIDREMVKAAKAKDKLRLSALRMIKAAIHNRQIDLKRPIEEPDIMQVLTSLQKQRSDSIEQFKKGGREDLVEKEEAELGVVKEFLPRQMSADEVEKVISDMIKEVGASSPKDMGKVMKALMPKLTGKADGKMVSEMVKAKLSS